MITNPQELIERFVLAANQAVDCDLTVADISHDSWQAPHTAKDLKPRHGAVYVFTLSRTSKAEAQPGRALKVGKAGPNSNARFRYQHYKSGSAMSTLAGAIENNPMLWSYIGYCESSQDVGEWIRKNTDRDNFYIHEDKREYIGLLEVYIKANLGPVFEGSLSSKA